MSWSEVGLDLIFVPQPNEVQQEARHTTGTWAEGGCKEGMGSTRWTLGCFFFFTIVELVSWMSQQPHQMCAPTPGVDNHKANLLGLFTPYPYPRGEVCRTFGANRALFSRISNQIILQIPCHLHSNSKGTLQPLGGPFPYCEHTPRPCLRIIHGSVHM